MGGSVSPVFPIADLFKLQDEILTYYHKVNEQGQYYEVPTNEASILNVPEMIPFDSPMKDLFEDSLKYFKVTIAFLDAEITATGKNVIRFR